MQNDCSSVDSYQGPLPRKLKSLEARIWSFFLSDVKVRWYIHCFTDWCLYTLLEINTSNLQTYEFQLAQESDQALSLSLW
jgi:hypothetical protein